MQKRTVIFCVLATILLAACTKEKSIEGGVKQSLLMKMVAKLGTDSLVDAYGYDGSNRLISYSTSIHIQGNVLLSQATFERASSGVIQKVTLSSNQSVNQIQYMLNYNTASSRYTSAITTNIVSGQTVKDSTAFTYDAAGKIMQKEEFYDDGFSAGYVEAYKTTYAYDGDGNVIKATEYEFDDATGTYNQSAETTYEYDTRVNPLRMAIEAYLVNEPERASPNNVTKNTYTDSTDPTQNETINIAYTYNNDNKPNTASILYNSIGMPFTTTYYYQ